MTERLGAANKRAIEVREDLLGTQEELAETKGALLISAMHVEQLLGTQEELAETKGALLISATHVEQLLAEGLPKEPDAEAPEGEEVANAGDPPPRK